MMKKRIIDIVTAPSSAGVNKIVEACNNASIKNKGIMGIKPIRKSKSGIDLKMGKIKTPDLQIKKRKVEVDV
jgi:hypothetical protein